MSCNSPISILAQALCHCTSIPQVLARPSCVTMKAVKTMKAMKTTIPIRQHHHQQPCPSLADGAQLESENADDQVDGMDMEMLSDKGVWFPLRADAADEDNELESENDLNHIRCSKMLRMSDQAGTDEKQFDIESALQIAYQYFGKLGIDLQHDDVILIDIDLEHADDQDIPLTWTHAVEKAVDLQHVSAGWRKAAASQSRARGLVPASGELEQETAEMAVMDTMTRFRNLVERIGTVNAADKIAEVVRGLQSLPPSPVEEMVLPPGWRQVQMTDGRWQKAAPAPSTRSPEDGAESAASGDSWSGRWSESGSSADGSTAYSQNSSSSHMEEQ